MQPTEYLSAFVIESSSWALGMSRQISREPVWAPFESAQDCREDTDTIWGHDLLRHNASELARLRHQVRPILF